MADPNEIDVDIDMDNDDDKKKEDSIVLREERMIRKKKKKPKIELRNYIPKDQKLRKKYCVTPASFIEIKDEFTELIEKAKILNHDIHDITPKKANWDLKRDCQSQLDQLKYLTQIAIRKLVGMEYLFFFFYLLQNPCTIYQSLLFSNSFFSFTLNL